VELFWFLIAGIGIALLVRFASEDFWEAKSRTEKRKERRSIW